MWHESSCAADDDSRSSRALSASRAARFGIRLFNLRSGVLTPHAPPLQAAPFSRTILASFDAERDVAIESIFLSNNLSSNRRQTQQNASGAQQRAWSACAHRGRMPTGCAADSGRPQASHTLELDKNIGS